MPRPGTNSSSEASTSIKGTGRINPKNSAACLWGESPAPRGPRKHGESVQMAFRRRLQAPNIGPLCTEVIVPFKLLLKCYMLKPSPQFDAISVLSELFCNVSYRCVPFTFVYVSTLPMSLVMEACLSQSA